MCSSQTKLKLTLVESFLTSMALGISTPILTLFWTSIGMTQTLFGVTQMLFTVALLVLDIPMSYIADRWSRRGINVIGNFGIALALGVYAMATSFWWVVLAEILTGVFCSLTYGVDRALLKNYTDGIDPSGELFQKYSAHLGICKYVGAATAILIGTYCIQFGLRVVVGIGMVPVIIAAIVALFLTDNSEKHVPIHKSYKDILETVGSIIKIPGVGWLVAAYAVASRMSQSVIWVFTPLMVLAGVPVHLVGLGWLGTRLGSIVGARLAIRTRNISVATRFAIPILILTACLSPMVFSVNLITVSGFIGIGITHGYTETALLPAIQRRVPEQIQSTAISVAATAARVLYAGAVVFVNWAGRVELTNAIVATLVIFIGVATPLYIKLRTLDKASQTLSGGVL